MDSYYDSIASGYNELHAEEQLEKYRIIASYLKLPVDARVLDVGAGTGIGHEIIPSIGVEPAAELLKQHPNKQSVQGTAESLPFSDNSFDAVLCVTAIHHTDYKKAVSEMLRVAKQWIAVTILKKAAKHDEILSHLEGVLGQPTVLNSDKDTIVIARKA